MQPAATQHGVRRYFIRVDSGFHFPFVLLVAVHCESLSQYLAPLRLVECIHVVLAGGSIRGASLAGFTPIQSRHLDVVAQPIRTPPPSRQPPTRRKSILASAPTGQHQCAVPSCGSTLKTRVGR